jgi:hypothetical protein
MGTAIATGILATLGIEYEAPVVVKPYTLDLTKLKAEGYTSVEFKL